MEWWNSGIVVVKDEKILSHCQQYLQTHHSITPVFQYSSCDA